MQKFLRTLVLVAFMLMPWAMQAQNAKVSEYDYTVGTATFNSVASTGTAWTADNVAQGYVDVTMPFSMYFGENQVQQGDVLRVYPDGSATFTNLDGSLIAPMYYSTGYIYSSTSIHTSSTSASLTIEWRKVVAGSSSYSFQLKLYSTGNIRFCYGPMTLNSSISVLVGMRSSATDQFLCSGNDWSEIVRTNSWTASHTVNATNAPAYNLTTGEGLIYTFTQPACVKPTAITAEATAWNTVNVGWTVAAIGSKYEIAYSTDPDFDASAAGVTRVTVNQGTADSYDVTGLQGSTTYYFAVRKYCGSTPSGWLYGASATTLPSCYSANMPSITPDGVVSWTSPNEMVTSYDVKYGLQGFDPETEGTAVNNITGLTTTLPLASMTPASTFDVYIRTHCSASSTTTEWVGPVSFNTPCGAVSIPYTMEFENDNCWTLVSMNEVNASTSPTSSNYFGTLTYNGYSVLVFNSWSNASDYNQYAYSPQYDASSVSGGYVRVRVRYSTYGSSDPVRFGYATNASTNPDDYTWSETFYTNGYNDWQLYEAIIPNTANRLAIHYAETSCQYKVYIDYVIIDTPPTCPEPAISSVTADGMVSWEASINATSYDLKWGLSGFNPETEGTAITLGNVLTHTLTGMESNTEYDVYIRAHCSSTNEVTDWIGPYSFHSACQAIPVTAANPFIEDFESYNGSTSGVTFEANCWMNEHISGSGAYFFEVYSGSNGGNSTKQLRLRDMSSGTMTKLVLPPMNLPNANYRFVLDVYRNATGSSYPAEGIRVFVSTNGEIEGATELAFISRNCTQTDGNLIPAESGSGWYTYELPIGISGNCYIIIRGESKYGSHTYMDNFKVEAIPTCLVPTNLAAVPAATSAELSWTENSGTPATQWEVRYWNGTDTVSVITNANPCTVNYLAMGTTYNWQVRSLCSAEDQSSWSVENSFATDACLSFTANPDIELGDHTENSDYLPFNGYYKYSVSEQIYTPAEISTVPTTINSISYNVITANSANRNPVDIYLLETDKESFSSASTASEWVSVAGLTPNYTGVAVANSTGWKTINLTTPFNYSGQHNLLVVFVNRTGSYSNHEYIGTVPANGNQAIYAYQDGSSVLTPANASTASNKNVLSVKNNFKFGNGTCDQGTCQPPTVAITVGPDGDNAKADLTFTGDEDAFGYICGVQGFTPNVANGVTVTGNTATITPLVPETTYDLYVYSVCTGVDNPRMVRYSFTTPFVPTCKPQANFATSNVTYTGATVTWQQEDPNQVPEGWTVRYAVNDIIDLDDASTYTEVNVTTASLPFTGLHNGDHIYMYTKATCNAAQNDYSVNWSSYDFTLPIIAAPTALTNFHTTNSSDSLSWTEATEGINSWTVAYATTNFDPTDANAVYETLAATNDSVKLTGLDAYATYYVYVRANSDDEHSDWSTMATFKTMCPDGGSATIGEGTSGVTGVPVYSSYGNTFSQMIFTAEELAEAGMQAGDIAGLTFTWNNNSSYAKEFSIYMGHTDKSTFSSSTDYVTFDNLTQVYGPEVHPLNTSGEVEYTFTTPFAWDGTSNIVVSTFMNQYNGSTSSSGFTAKGGAAGATRSLYRYRDSYAYTPEYIETNQVGSTTTYGSTSSNRANITFIAPCNTDVTCFAPASISATVTPANVVTLNWAPRTDLEPIVNNYQVKYGLEGFNPETQGTLIDNLNGVTTTTINGGLAAEQNYDIYVRTVCGGGDYSNWTKGSFVTYPSCWAPVDLTFNGTTSNSATLSWSNDSIAPTAGNRWEVVYGFEGFNPDEAVPVETTNRENFTVTGLRHSSKYEFYVRTKCSADDFSPWSAVVSATTQCGAWQYADMPLIEDFDGVTGKTSGTEANHVLPNCWDYSNDATSSSYVGYPICYNSSSYSRSGNNHLRFYTNYTSSSYNYGNQIAIFPPVDFNVDTLVLEFYARKYSTSSSYQSNIIVGVMSDPADASSFEEVATLHATGTTYEPFTVDFSEYQGNGRYVAIKAERVDGSSGNNYVLIDDVTLKLREKVNVLPNNGDAMTICQEFVQLDTVNGTYANGLNATYVIRPAEAGKVAHINGSYDLESGYDFLYVYRGEGANKVIADTLTGSGDYDFMAETNDWVNYGAITLVMKSDADNALPYGGFKFIVTCECPAPAVDMPVETVEANGSYTWTEGNGETYLNHATSSYASDRVENIDYTFTNVAGCDSVYRHLALTIHPDYTLNYAATICERDEYEFYGNTYSEAGTYTVTLQSVTGADSTGILALTVNSAPVAYIQYNNRTVTELANMCDNYDMTLNARSNFANATFLWEDNSTAAARIVNPHESNVYTVVAVNPATSCTSLPATVTVTTTPVPALTISGDSEICYGQSATLTLVDANEVPATYRWSNNSTATSITVSPTETTTYTVAATSTTGSCVATAEFTVVVNPLPVVEVAAAPAVVCQNDMITLTASKVAGYRYGWSTGNEGDIANVAASATGSFTLTVTDRNGCVNEFTTNNVTVNPVYELNDEQSACVGMLPYTWGMQSLSEAGSYDQTFQTVNSCDSTVHLTFTVQDTANNNSYRELCEGATFTFGTGIYEQQYTATENTVISYVDTTSGECPARYNLYLTVNTHNPATVENTVCDSYVWPLTGETYDRSGDYQAMLKTTKGCDSLVTLNLTVNYKNTGIDEQVACDSYEWIDGNTYTADNNSATYTLRNVYGCDSVVTLKLAVNYRSYHEDFHRVCDAPNFTWDDNEVYSLDVELADSIQHITGENEYGCLEIALLHLDMNYVSDRVTRDTVVCDEFTIDTVSCDYGVETAYLRESGVYTLRVHNDSLDRDEILTLNLTVIPSTHHTNVVTSCLPYTWSVYKPDSSLYEVATITASDVNGASVYTMSFDMAEAGFAASSCSNIEVLRLTPIYPSEEVVEATICQNGTWTAPGDVVSYNGSDLNIGLNTLTWSTDTNAAGCLHYKKVALTVNPVVADTVNMTYCESRFIYTDNDVAYLNYIEGNDTLRLTIPATGLNETVYTNTLVANWETEAGCARTVTVNYTVNPVISETDTVKAFLRYVWDANDKLYEGVGHYTDVVWYNDSVTGCRASRVLDLEISDYIRIYDTIIVCTQYELDGKTYYEDNTFEEQLNENTIHYTTYHVTQRTLTDVNIVTNQPYTWINGETYTANASNVYYSVPAAVQGECDDVYRLNLTMVEPISICEGQLPYATGYGFTIDAAANGVYNNLANDTIIAYTVKLNTSNAINKTACDSYTWHGNTYTEGGSYNFDTVNAAGCDSTVTLNLTINASTTGTVDVTVCDSYTWHDSTYSQSGSYTFGTVNAAGCDSTATLTLVINKNNGVTETVTACDSYTWNGVTYTADANVTKTFNDLNGCAGDSVLNLTVNYSVSSYPEMIVNEASTIYMGRLYNAPFDDVVSDTLKNSAANGCDSIVNMHLQLNTGLIITEDTVSCGDFTWRDGYTYTWIPMAQRTNPVFNYAKITETGLVPVEDFPVYETYSNGIVVNTYVLHLTMVEARTEYKNVIVLLSRDTYTDPADTSNHVFDFTAEKAAKQNATKLDTLHYSGSIYCDSIVYYTFNLSYNYVDDDPVTVCYTDSVYTTQNGTVIALNEGINVFTDTMFVGTDAETVHNKVYVRSAAITGTETITACDNTTWNNTLYTSNVVDEQVTLTAANGCDSVVTLNITITPTVHNVIEPANVCDSYTWTTGNGETYTANTTATWSRANTTNAQCTDVDTLKLVVKHSTTGTDAQVACDTYGWIDGNIYTENNTTATKTLTNAAGCDSVVTLNLTVNHSFTGAGRDIDTLGATIVLSDKNGNHTFIAPFDDDVTFNYQTVAGCDSTVTFHLTLNQFRIVAENPIECGKYTWNEAGHGTGHTYVWISDEERNANAINIPGISPMLPLYKDVNTNAYVYNRPMDTVGDIVYMLNLNLNEAQFVDSTIALFPQSVETLTLHGETLDFTGMTSASKPTADTTVSILLPNDDLCGTWMTYNVHVVYNYRSDSETLCYTDSYTWEDGQTETLSVGSQTITKTLYVDNWDSLRVVTRTITVRANNNTYEFDQEACDSYTWNDNVYTTSGDYTQNFTDQYGCDSVATLHLTMKYNTDSVQTLAGCDSVLWHGIWYYADNDSATYVYTSGNGCPSVTTLNLTINHNEPQVTYDTACHIYTWSLNSNQYDESGVYTAIRTDDNTCQAVDTLKLTIRQSSSYDSVMYVTDGSYLYIDQNNNPTLITSGNVATFAEHYTNAAGCDSTVNIEIHVGSGVFFTEDTSACNSFTWRDGNTYVWISAEERAANGNALYKNQTTGAYVMSNPIYNAPTDTFDVIYMLRLNLTQNKVEYHTINFPISRGTLTYGDSTFSFATTNDEGREFVNTIVEREVHFASDYYCDSIHYLTINLQNNYSEVIADAADICVTQSSYTWRNHTINTATTDFDHAHTYYIYDTVGTAEAPVVEYIRVTQHPVVYATERRTACDSYTWNGTVYTESTSGATFDTVDMWGCDSTVTLLLTVNHNSSSAEETTVCDTYTWTAGNGQSYTYTESGVYLSDVYLTNKGCESRDTLRLTVNYTTNNAYTANECGSYEWNNTVYTESGDYTYSYDNSVNCPSVDTLHLTIRNTTNQGYTQVACDSYEWHDSVYTASTTAYYEYENANGCVSVDTLYLTINASTTATVNETVCDSYNWHGNIYVQSGTYTWNTTNDANCTHVDTLKLTVNSSTHNSESAVACDSYTWHNTEYTTSGVMTYEYSNGSSCPSVDTLHLTVYHSDYNGVNYANQTVADWCGEYTWVVNDSVVGIYTESVETSTSVKSPVTTCDSIIFLNLTIKHAPVVDTVATVCENILPYVWRGIEMNASGVETVAFPLENGCDSTIRFTLTVNPKFETPLTANVCLGSGFEGYNFNIPAEQLNTLGEHVFVDSLTSVNGCDSIVTLTVNVKTYYNTTVEYTACDEFLWDLNGETYNESGNYNHTIIAVNNCDSVVTLALTINNSTTGVDEQTACNRYTWIDGETYTASNNTATFTMENAAGCDSVITLDLTVNYSNNYEFADVACDVYTWNGATYSQSGDYTYAGTNMDGCDSVVTMHLTVNNSTTSVVTDEACESYTWETGNGQTYTESGNYTFAIVNGNAIGCDSVITLALNIKKATRGIDVQTACENFTWMDGETYYASNNEATYTLENAAGCDSVVTLNLTINTATYGNDKQSACESFTWIDGETYYASNDEATYRLTGANGCDSVVTLDLTINTPSTGIDVQTACDTYTWMDGNVYTASNNEATYTLANADMNGCDSIVTLNLTINNSTTSSEVAATCGEFEWHGQSYSQNGLYTFDTINAVGCDSTVYLSLVVNQSISTTSEATACDSYEWNGETYTESGVYTFTSQTDGGCESIATLLLTIKKSTNNAENVTVCDNYTWNNTQYSTSGDYTYSYTNAAGCASTDTLHLTINASTTETVNAIACDSYTWQNGNGNTYLQSGTYTWNTTNANNCNHVVTLNLTINNATSSTVTETACNSFVWNGQTYTETGVYTWNGTNAANCDSVATLMLMINQPYASSVERTACESYTWTTGNGQTYTQSGNYDYTTTALNGCDSVVTLVLTINTPANTTETLTACDSLTWLNGNGQLYTESGVYTYNFTDNNGCQATSTLNLTINQHVDTYAEAEDCSSYTWSVTGETYTESGVYTAAITDGNNCAATAHLTLAINGGTSELMTVTACDAFTWTEGNGQTYTETPAYSVSYNTLNAHGCPHVIYLDLTINHSDTVVIPVTAVGSYTWNDTTLTSSGTYFYNTTNVAGCDSIVTLLLTIEQPVVKYYVTLLSDNASMGVVSGSANDSVVENTVFTATATANDGYQFVYWMSNTGDVITENPYSFQVTSDMTLTAYFEAVLVNYTVSARTYTVIAPGDTLIDQQGSILGTGVYESGTTATLTAQADSGYHFLYWSNGLSTATITFTVTGDIELIAYFEKDAEPQAVEVADMDNVVIFSNDTRIIVRGAEGHDVTVFDVNGRMISRKLNAADEVEFRMAATGVYLVKVGNAPAKRVLVVR